MMVINKESITDQIYNLLMERIINQEIEFGQQINPKKIAKENGISVMPVRDALLKLVNHGFVTNKPRVGFFVRSFSTEEVNEILEVRKMYETFCLREYFDNIDRKTVEALLDRFNTEDEEGIEVKLFNKYDTQLHWAIIEASENNYLIERYNKLIDYFILLFRYLNNQRYKVSNQEHKTLIKAIIENNKELAVKTLYSHLEKVNIAVVNAHNKKAL